MPKFTKKRKRSRKSPYPPTKYEHKGSSRSGYSASSMRGSINSRSGGFLGIEKKFVDLHLNNHLISNSANASGYECQPANNHLCLNAVGSGSGESQRDGRHIQAVSLNVRGIVDWGRTDAAVVAREECYITVWVVKDTQTNGATISSENVLKNSNGNTIMAPFVHNNLENTSRYRIMGKKTLKLTPKLAVSNTEVPVEVAGDQAAYDHNNSIGMMQSKFEFYFNLDERISYKSTGTTVADIVDTSYHVLAAASHTGPRMFYASRFRYIG